MKKIITLVIGVSTIFYSNAQVTNTFPNNGDVGIGTINPASKLHISEGASGGTPHSFSKVTLEDAENSMFSILTPNSKIGYFGFADNDDSYVGGMQYSHSSNSMTFRVNNHNSDMVINSLGWLGIGTSTPASKLHISEGISGGNPHAFSKVTLEDVENSMFSILTPNNKIGYFGFADSDDSYVGGMQYSHSSNLMTFRVNNHNSDMVINSSGNVGIGTTTPQNELSVNGTIWAKEVKVALVDAADWVFEKDYDLKPLEEVEEFIEKNKHLPEIPSAEEFRKNDLNVSEMSNKLLQKIEELTLYIIDLNKEVKEIKKENIELKKELTKFDKQ